MGKKEKLEQLKDEAIKKVSGGGTDDKSSMKKLPSGEFMVTDRDGYEVGPFKDFKSAVTGYVFENCPHSDPILTKDMHEYVSKKYNNLNISQYLT